MNNTTRGQNQLAEIIRSRLDTMAKQFRPTASVKLVHVGTEMITLSVLLQPRGTEHPDGPEAPNEFWVGGKSVELGPKPWKLLNVLWTEGKIDVPGLYQRVWGGGPVNRANLRQAVYKANQALSELCQLRLMVQLDDNTISLEGRR